MCPWSGGKWTAPTPKQREERGLSVLPPPAPSKPSEPSKTITVGGKQISVAVKSPEESAKIIQQRQEQERIAEIKKQETPSMKAWKDVQISEKQEIIEKLTQRKMTPFEKTLMETGTAPKPKPDITPFGLAGERLKEKTRVSVEFLEEKGHPYIAGAVGGAGSLLSSAVAHPYITTGVITASILAPSLIGAKLTYGIEAGLGTAQVGISSYQAVAGKQLVYSKGIGLGTEKISHEKIKTFRGEKFFEIGLGGLMIYGGVKGLIKEFKTPVGYQAETLTYGEQVPSREIKTDFGKIDYSDVSKQFYDVKGVTRIRPEYKSKAGKWEYFTTKGETTLVPFPEGKKVLGISAFEISKEGKTISTVKMMDITIPVSARKGVISGIGKAGKEPFKLEGLSERFFGAGEKEAYYTLGGLEAKGRLPVEYKGISLIKGLEETKAEEFGFGMKILTKQVKAPPSELITKQITKAVIGIAEKTKQIQPSTSLLLISPKTITSTITEQKQIQLQGIMQTQKQIQKQIFTQIQIQKPQQRYIQQTIQRTTQLQIPKQIQQIAQIQIQKPQTKLILPKITVSIPSFEPPTIQLIPNLFGVSGWKRPKETRLGKGFKIPSAYQPSLLALELKIFRPRARIKKEYERVGAIGLRPIPTRVKI